MDLLVLCSRDLPCPSVSPTSSDALKKNQALEFERNNERFQFLKVRGTGQMVAAYCTIVL